MKNIKPNDATILSILLKMNQKRIENHKQYQKLFDQLSPNGQELFLSIINQREKHEKFND